MLKKLEKNQLTELKRFLRSKGYTQNKIAEIIGVSPSMINIMLSGRRNFGNKTAHDWAAAFGLNPMWLMYGTGEMIASADNNTVNNTGNHNKTQIGGFSLNCCPSDEEISEQLDELCNERIKELEEEVKQLREERTTLITIINNLSKRNESK